MELLYQLSYIGLSILSYFETLPAEAIHTWSAYLIDLFNTSQISDREILIHFLNIFNLHALCTYVTLQHYYLLTKTTPQPHHASQSLPQEIHRVFLLLFLCLILYQVSFWYVSAFLHVNQLSYLVLSIWMLLENPSP